MNYIKLLEKRQRRLEALEAAMQHERVEIVRYLTSSKFDTDSTVQVADVMHRLEQAQHRIHLAGDVA